MSRKNLLVGLGAESSAPAQEPAPASGAPSVAHLGKMLNVIRDRSERADEIEKALAAGERVVEIETASIDPSPIADRLPASPQDEASLRDSIAEHGQRAPVLLRAHPQRSGRFLTIYGHRRIAAATTLGRRVRAIVVEMSDEEAFVAQGVENAERKDLSFIERALFARRLTDAGVPAKSVAAALGTARPNVVTMVTLSRRLPDDLIAAVGPSPTLGRRRWEELGARLSEAGRSAAQLWRKAIEAPGFGALDVETRFAAILQALASARPTAAPGGWNPTPLVDDGGELFGSMEKMRSGETRLRISPDKDASFRKDGAAFSDWLASRMSDLRAAWRRGD